MRAKIDIKVGRERLRYGRVNIMVKHVPNLKTEQMKEGQGARGTQRKNWVLSEPV